MKTSRSTLSREVLESATFRIDENLRMVRKSLGSLKEEDLWKKPNESSNSIGNILLHLCGNITQYILSGLDGREDLRKRDQEFSTIGGYTKEELTGMLADLIREAKALIGELSEERLTRHYRVQGFDLSGAGILLHVVEHFPTIQARSH